MTKTKQQTLCLIMEQEDSENSNNLRFEEVDEETKQHMLANRKAVNTNKATKQWIDCLESFLKERNIGPLRNVSNEDLPKFMGDFYLSACKKRISEDGTDPSCEKKSKLKHHKNSSLKSGCAAINRYFKAEQALTLLAVTSIMQMKFSKP